MDKVKQYLKFWVALLTAVLVAVNQVVISGTAQHWITVALAALGALSVYAVPNSVPPSAPPTT